MYIEICIALPIQLRLANHVIHRIFSGTDVVILTALGIQLYSYTDTEIFESTCTAGKEEKLCQPLNISKQATWCENKGVIQHKRQHVLSRRVCKQVFFFVYR